MTAVLAMQPFHQRVRIFEKGSRDGTRQRVDGDQPRRNKQAATILPLLTAVPQTPDELCHSASSITFKPSRPTSRLSRRHSGIFASCVAIDTICRDPRAFPCAAAAAAALHTFKISLKAHCVVCSSRLSLLVFISSWSEPPSKYSMEIHNALWGSGRRLFD